MNLKRFSVHRNAPRLLVLVALLLTGCATVRTDYVRTSATAFQEHESTTLGRQIAKDAAQRPGESGFALMRYGHQAFTARIALADLAQKSIDVQYYIWEADATGRILAERLARAAERGVRVRVLIDDANLVNLDATVASFDAHPNIEVRLFNPFAQRTAKTLDFIVDFERVNHRMHNKLMVVDNAVAIVGGRNMSDPYFGVHPDQNFRDLDVVAIGPVVRDLSKVFDRFWNGDWAVPIAALVDHIYTTDDYAATTRAAREGIASGQYPYPLERDVAELEAELDTLYRSFIWAPARVIWDDPASISDPGLRTMNRWLASRTGRLETEVLAESAYFVPLQDGVALIKRLRERGVRVRILTNSLVSNDVLSAFAGYSKYRADLVASGVEVYELRPDAGPIRQRMFFGVRGGSRAGLHTKAIVFDRKDVFIGSFNLDPRSSFINTEAGLHIESPVLAAQLAEHMTEGVLLDNAYRVLQDPTGKLYWVTKDAGREIRYDEDPLSTFAQRLEAGLIRMLPIDNLL